MMESMSNAVAILLVTGGAFREPSSGHYSARHFHVTHQLPRDSTLFFFFFSFFQCPPFNPLYNTALPKSSIFFFSFFMSFFRLPSRSLSVTRPMRSTLVKLLAAFVSIFWWGTLYLFTGERMTIKSSSKLCVYFTITFYDAISLLFSFLFSFFCPAFACRLISFLSLAYRWNRSCPTKPFVISMDT